MGNSKNLINQVFGYLKVIKRVENDKRGSAQWLCKCKCGNETIVTTNRLTSGMTQSCGCKKRESHNKVHGMTKTDLYNKWSNMKERCNNPNYPSYKRYGKVGIKVCDDWNESFESFMHWSLQNGYKDGLSIDRIDNEKGYSPSNCRWVSWHEQCTNRRNNIKIEYNGKTQTLKEWCCELGVPYNRTYQRMKRDGYPFEIAIYSKPYEHRNL